MSPGVVCVSREEGTQKAGAGLCIAVGGRGSPEAGVCVCTMLTQVEWCVSVAMKPLGTGCYPDWGLGLSPRWCLRSLAQQGIPRGPEVEVLPWGWESWTPAVPGEG